MIATLGVLTLLALWIPKGAKCGEPDSPPRAVAPAAVEPALPRGQPSRPPLSQRFEKEGIEVTLTVRPLDGADRLVAGAEVEILYTVREATTGEPITGLHPLSWIHRRLAPIRPSIEELKELISTFLGGLLSVRADIDLNRYYLLVLNDDSSVSVIDPQIEFSKTKLYQMMMLEGPGEAWCLDDHGERLFVVVSGKARIECLDLTTFESLGFVEVGEGNQPRDLILEPDGDILWVGLDSSNAVIAIDTRTRAVLERIRVGVGLHRLAMTDDGKTLCVSSSRSGEVVLIDLATRTVRATLKTGDRPYPARYSVASRLFYVGHAGEPKIVAIEPESGTVRATIETEGPLLALDLDPAGRFLFGCDLENSTVTIIDVATHLPVGVIRGVKNPDHVAFSENFAYIRSVGSPSVAMIDLSRLERGEMVMTDLSVSRLPAKDAPSSSSIASMIAPTPEGNAVMIASPADRLIYYYVEGMMASMGNFQTYGRTPRGIEVLDRSLRETAPGVYSTFIRPVLAGRFDVPIVIDQPRFIHGFELEIDPAPDSVATPVAAPITISPLFRGEKVLVGETRKLRFQVIDTATDAPVAALDDVQVMVIRGQGIQQDRYRAVEIEPGTYEFEHHFPARDRYQVLFQVPSRGGTFRDLPMFSVPALSKTEGKPWEKPKPAPTPPKPAPDAGKGGRR